MKLSIRGRSRRARRTRAGSMLALALGGAVVVFAAAVGPLRQLQDAFHDALFRPQSGSPNIVLVAIGEEELEQYGRLGSWPRTLHAQAIDRLSAARANVIAYDFLFADEGEDDAALAGAIADAGNVVLAVAGDPESSADGRTLYEFTLPAPAIAAGARSLGHSHVEPDGDGRVRRVALRADATDGSAYPSLALAAFYLQFGRDAQPAPAGARSLDLIGRTAPLEDGESLRVNYAGSAREFKMIPFQDALDGNFDPETVEGKVVFVGVTATGIDRHSAPLLGNAAGVEIQMNSLDTMLRDRFLEVAPAWVMIAAGLALTLLTAVTVPRLGAGLALAIVVAGGVSWLFASAAGFYFGYLLDPVHPLAALLVATGAALAYRVASERASQREVIDLFGRHVSDRVVHELVGQSDRGELRLGGEVREVTVMFCDVRGYTTFSQGMDPAELVGILNASFDAIVSSVVANGGIVNKFVGDALMAFWNAPHDQPDHAFLACCAARDAQRRLAEVEGPELRWGFGVTTGPALAGNVGSAGRFEYTLMGETVNTSSRLSGVAPGGEAWIDDRTRELLAGRFPCDELPPQSLKGMAHAVSAYRLTLDDGARTTERETVGVAS